MNRTTQIEDIARQLQEWSQEKRLIEEAFDGCRTFMENSERDDKEAGLTARWKLSDIQLHFDKQSLVFRHGVFSHVFIENRIGLYVAAEDKRWFRDIQPVGHYRLTTSLDGQAEDDYLVVDDGYHLA